jgi:hypothetical protein
MMWAKRLLAVAAALGLIAGALVVRDRWIDDDASAGDGDAATLVCLDELRAICDAVAAEHTDLTVITASAADAMSELSGIDDDADQVWLTFAPLPEVVERGRAAARREPLGFTAHEIAASSLALVVPTDRAAMLEAHCAPLTWACVGETAGQPWETIGGQAAWREVRPAFAPLSTGVGQLGVASAVRGFFGDTPITADDPQFITWARRLGRAVESSSLSSATAVATIQVRRSLLDVAVGAEAELAIAQRDQLATLYAAPMTRIDVVLAVPDGVAIPGRLAADLRTAALDAGWQGPGTAGLGDAIISADDLIVATQLWEDLS